MESLVYEQVVSDSCERVGVSQITTDSKIFINIQSGVITLDIYRKIMIKQLKGPPPLEM